MEEEEQLWRGVSFVYLSWRLVSGKRSEPVAHGCQQHGRMCGIAQEGVQSGESQRRSPGERQYLGSGTGAPRALVEEAEKGVVNREVGGEYRTDSGPRRRGRSCCKGLREGED